METPFDIVKDLVLNNLKKTRESNKLLFEQSERLIIWVVGFSIGGISLIVGKLSDSSEILGHSGLRIVLILLTSSVVFGVLYRVSFYFYQIYFRAVENSLEFWFSNSMIYGAEAKEFEGEADIMTIIHEIKKKFGDDLSYMLNLYNISDDKGKQAIVNSLKDHYKKMADWSKVSLEKAFDFLKQAYSDVFKISPKKAEKIIRDSSPGKNLKIWEWITLMSYIFSCLSFLSVLVLICFLIW